MKKTHVIPSVFYKLMFKKKPSFENPNHSRCFLFIDDAIKIFKNAGVGDLSSEYIFELDNIYVDREHRGVGLGEYILNRLILLRTGRGTTLYCQTNSEDISRVLKTNHRFENLKDNDDKPYLLGLM